MARQQVDRATFGPQWQEWHAGRERQLADPHGFLSITGLHWLTAEPASFPRAPGRWWSDDLGVGVALEDGQTLLLDESKITGEHRFGLVPERASWYVAWDDAVIEIAKRGGRDLLRPRHPDHPLRTGFREAPSYLPNPRWALLAQYRPFAPPRPTTVGSVVEGLEHVYDAPGELEFELRGETFKLTAFGAPDRGLLVLFTDATSGITTYPAGRSLSADPPDSEGQVALDFNRAVNLPCAFTDFATCPLAPPENRLPIGIEAGEKTPYERA